MKTTAKELELFDRLTAIKPRNDRKVSRQIAKIVATFHEMQAITIEMAIRVQQGVVYGL